MEGDSRFRIPFEGGVVEWCVVVEVTTTLHSSLEVVVVIYTTTHHSKLEVVVV